MISSCFVQQKKWAFEKWPFAEVQDWTPLRKEKGVEVTADGVDCPSSLLKDRKPGAGPRLRAPRSTFQVAWALAVCVQGFGWRLGKEGRIYGWDRNGPYLYL